MADFFVKYSWQLVLVAGVCYLFGGINYAILFSRLIKHKDIRAEGSGNAGTTNVFRVFGLRMGALIFLCDTLKGVVVCLACKFIFAPTDDALAVEYFAGFFVVLGHIFPVFHNFRGGKGVATSMGVCLVVRPLLMLCCILPICIVIFVVDRMSVMSLIFAIFMVVWHWTMLFSEVGPLCCIVVSAMFLLVVFAHRHNILRIFTGREKRTGVRRKILRQDKREAKRLLAEQQLAQQAEVDAEESAGGGEERQ